MGAIKEMNCCRLSCICARAGLGLTSAVLSPSSPGCSLIEQKGKGYLFPSLTHQPNMFLRAPVYFSDRDFKNYKSLSWQPLPCTGICNIFSPDTAGMDCCRASGSRLTSGSAVVRDPALRSHRPGCESWLCHQELGSLTLPKPQFLPL